MRIGIIGGGTVGRATARAFIEHVDEVRVYDVVPERATHSYAEVACGSDITFVCLPTPQKKGSLDCDISIVEGFFKNAQEVGHGDFNFVLRSTVPIGTTKRLAQEYGLSNLVHSPEFLTARCAVTDAHLPSRNIIGIPVEDVANDLTNVCGHILENLYLSRFPGVPCLCMKADESEAVKLFTNGFFATKIGYFNEVYQLAQKLDLDWDRVMEGVLSDGRIAHSHTKVPGPDGKLGFGGSCLPKDLASLKYQLLNNGCGLGVVSSVHDRNREFKRD